MQLFRKWELYLVDMIKGKTISKYILIFLDPIAGMLTELFQDIERFTFLDLVNPTFLMN